MQIITAEVFPLGRMVISMPGWATVDHRAIPMATVKIQASFLPRFFAWMWTLPNRMQFQPITHLETRCGHTACAIPGGYLLISSPVIYTLAMWGRVPGKRSIISRAALQVEPTLAGTCGKVRTTITVVP